MKKKSLRTVIIMLVVLVLVTVLAFTGLPLGNSKYYVANVGEALSKGADFGDGYEAVFEYVAPEETEEEPAEETEEAAAEEPAEEAEEAPAEEPAEEAEEAPAEEPAAEPVDAAEAAKAAADIIGERLKARGLYDAKVTLNDDNTVTVKVGDYDQSAETLSILGTAGNVEFRNEAGDVILDKSGIKYAEPYMNGDAYYALVHFTDEGRAKIAAATAEMIGSAMYVYIDDSLFTYASISEALDNESIFMPMAADTKENTYLLAAGISMIINTDEIPVSFTMKSAEEVENTSATPVIAAAVTGALVVACMVYLIAAFKKSGIGAAMGIWAFALIAAYITVGVGSMINWVSLIALYIGLALCMYWLVIALKRAKIELDTGRSVDSSFNFAYKNVRPVTYIVALGALVVAIIALFVLKGAAKVFANTLWIGVVSAFIAAAVIGKPLARVSARI